MAGRRGIGYLRGVRFLKLAAIAAVCSSLQGWNGAGHRTIAYIAYRQMDARTRARVDADLTAHPDYGRWVQGIPEADRALAAFLHAAVWADEIRGDDRYQNEPRGQVLGLVEYPDHYKHQNWHYVDEPLGGEMARPAIDDALNADWRAAPNVMTQIRAMEGVIASAGSSREAKAWAMAWLIHLVGDIHQPLHCVSRYTREGAAGEWVNDAGGNRVRLAGPYHNLHGLWDGLMGADDSLPAVRAMGEALMATAGAERDATKVDDWQREGAELAVEFVYPGLAGAKNEQGTLSVSPEYVRIATGIASGRVRLAGYRLAREFEAEEGR